MIFCVANVVEKGRTEEVKERPQNALESEDKEEIAFLACRLTAIISVDRLKKGKKVALNFYHDKNRATSGE